MTSDSIIKTTDYCGSLIYEQGRPKMLLVDGGFVTFDGNNSNSNSSPTGGGLEGASYHYYLKDHLGNNRVVINSNDSIEQVNHYYPYGGVMAESTGSDTQRYKYNGKELDRMHGLDWMDYGARWMNGLTFTTPDPKAWDYTDVGAYVYCMDNPIRLIDIKGEEPGDYFESADKAAEDFGKFYNTKSIISGREYASFIYKTEDAWGNVAYSYTVPKRGSTTSSKPDLKGYPRGAKIVADVHSHGDFIDDDRDGKSDYNDNDFSESDIKRYNATQKDGYLVTPNGTLQRFSVSSKTTSIISKNMPKKEGVTKDGKKIVSNTYMHTAKNKTASQRRKIWYEKKKEESLWDKWFYSTFIKIK